MTTVSLLPQDRVGTSHHQSTVIHVLSCHHCLSLLQAYTSEEAAARAAKLSRMRHLMFYAELKAKRLARIKSKEHHRRANRAAKRAAARAAEAAGDQHAEAKAAAEEAEFERAKVGLGALNSLLFTYLASDGDVSCGQAASTEPLLCSR